MSLVERFEEVAIEFASCLEQGEGLAFGPEGRTFGAGIDWGRGTGFDGFEVESKPTVRRGFGELRGVDQFDDLFVSGESSDQILFVPAGSD